MRACSTCTSKLGFAALVAGFLAYAFGWLRSTCRSSELPQFWGLPLAEYLARTDTPTGWGWLAHLHKGEFAGPLGIAISPGVRPCAWPRSFRCTRAAGTACSPASASLEILVLLLAASGVLTLGH